MTHKKDKIISLLSTEFPLDTIYIGGNMTIFIREMNFTVLLIIFAITAC